MYDYKQFNLDIRKFHRESNITAEKLGELIGVSKSTINGWSRLEKPQVPSRENYDLFYEFLDSKTDLSEFQKTKKGRPMLA